MNDAALTWLTRMIAQENAAEALWCSDENVLTSLPTIGQWPNKPFLMTNRWDVAQQAERLGFHHRFCDFDFSEIKAASLSHVFYRISKEKPVTHHIINQAHRLLIPGGKLFLCGQKNEGIKTYIDKAGKLFGCKVSAQKNGMVYTAVLENLTPQSDQWLDDNVYPQLRPIDSPDGVPIHSKPGLFGWNKIDQGSEFLIQALPALLAQLPEQPTRLLDLGCGYGYLTLMTADLPLEQRTLTDNNAAALHVARHNCELNNINADVIAADAGDQIQQTFDLILCNPPFHQGFSVDGDLTDKFILSTKRLLARHGTALFVVNQFIPLERKARQHFRQVNILANNGSFKLVTLGH